MTNLLRPSIEEAAAAYAELVQVRREQGERLAPLSRKGDRWVSRAADFRPGRIAALELETLCAHLRRSDVLLDVGAGAGRFAIPLSNHVERVVAVEPSASMREHLAGAIADASCDNIEVVPSEWPADVVPAVPVADVSLVANVLYGVEAIVPFLRELERHTTRTCMVVTFDRTPNAPIPEIWQAIHGEPFQEGPALRELVAVLLVMGRTVTIEPVTSHDLQPGTIEEIQQAFRWIYYVQPGDPGDQEFRSQLERRATGGVVRPPVVRRYSAVVSWPPDAS